MRKPLNEIKMNLHRIFAHCTYSHISIINIVKNQDFRLNRLQLYAFLCTINLFPLLLLKIENAFIILALFLYKNTNVSDVKI